MRPRFGGCGSPRIIAIEIQGNFRQVFKMSRNSSAEVVEIRHVSVRKWAKRPLRFAIGAGANPDYESKAERSRLSENAGAALRRYTSMRPDWVALGGKSGDLSHKRFGLDHIGPPSRRHRHNHGRQQQPKLPGPVRLLMTFCVFAVLKVIPTGHGHPWITCQP